MITKHRLSLVALCALIPAFAALQGCDSNPSTASATQTASSPPAEHCFVTGSNLRQRECRNPDVRSLSREDAERIQSQSMIIPVPKN
ncbi:MAG: hypothetical protein EAZ24_10460 [Burkholderiales bacterium]|nr:MAG: hypothetical protein EAZ24_10460 [Burkholderiales bacterium]TAG81473.1 MAG: hypothetical protein EAZ21_05990 [Betaproteobacteria bacterium]